jgi:hypothetical protein
MFPPREPFQVVGRMPAVVWGRRDRGGRRATQGLQSVRGRFRRLGNRPKARFGRWMVFESFLSTCC